MAVGASLLDRWRRRCPLPVGAQRCWLAFEWKWDGVRAIVAPAPGSVRTTSRNDRDITAFYPELDALGELADRPS